jgi:hypothetical protein
MLPDETVNWVVERGLCRKKRRAPWPTKTAASLDDFVDLDLTVYAKSAKQCFDVAELIRTSLDNFSGTLGSTTFQSFRFESLNLNHFANDDLFICGSEFMAHVKR